MHPHFNRRGLAFATRRARTDMEVPEPAAPDSRRRRSHAWRYVIAVLVLLALLYAVESAGRHEQARAVARPALVTAPVSAHPAESAPLAEASSPESTERGSGEFTHARGKLILSSPIALP